jgi:hypothetical protein
MSNNKQSSIEWLIEQLKEYDFSNEDDTYVIKIQSWVLTEKHEQAKSMHKEEITQAFDEGQEYEYQYHINSTPKFDSETYYNETFGGNNEQQ